MKFIDKLLLAALLIICGLFAVITVEPLYENFGWFLLGCAIILMLLKNKLPPFSRFLFLLISAFISVRYFAFRTMYTMSMQELIAFIPAIVLYLAESYAILSHLVGIRLMVLLIFL